MIQTWLRNQIAPLLPGFEVTVDNEADSPKGATVYYEGGAEPTDYDFAYMYPNYMVWIGSPDWGEVEFHAYNLAEKLKRSTPFIITVEFTDKNDNVLGRQDVLIKRIRVQSGPHRLGIDDGQMLYTLNLEATITLKGGIIQ